MPWFAFWEMAIGMVFFTCGGQYLLAIGLADVVKDIKVKQSLDCLVELIDQLSVILAYLRLGGTRLINEVIVIAMIAQMAILSRTLLPKSVRS